MGGHETGRSVIGGDRRLGCSRRWRKRNGGECDLQKRRAAPNKVFPVGMAGVSAHHGPGAIRRRSPRTGGARVSASRRCVAAVGRCVRDGRDAGDIRRRYEDRRQSGRHEFRGGRERAWVMTRVCRGGVVRRMAVRTERDFLEPRDRTDDERDPIAAARGLRHPTRGDERAEHEGREQQHGQTVAQRCGMRLTDPKRHKAIIRRRWRRMNVT